MKIAIVGAGFCGLAVAWNFLTHFSQIQNLELKIFDTKSIGGGASGIAAGLLHPYAGAHAKLNWRGLEGFAETKKLLALSSTMLGRSVTAERQGVLRLATTQKQQLDYKLSRALTQQDALWFDEKTCQQLIPGSTPSPALWIKEGLAVFCIDYLQGLWLACQQHGAKFEQRHVSSTNELKEYDLIILTTGASLFPVKETASVNVKNVKGQVLELKWPESISPLPYAINSIAYMVMKPDSHSCLVGSTYEKEFSDDQVDLTIATKEILPKVFQTLPFLKDAPIVCGYAGIRAVCANYLPLCKQLDHKTWFLTGMGSKGLLYHALMAKELVQTISSSIAH